jgi:hypothetical protein
MQFQHSLPSPWPEDLYWFDLYDRFPLLVRYRSFYSDNFQSREDDVQVWYYSSYANMDANSENYIDVVNRLLVHLGATEYYTEV